MMKKILILMLSSVFISPAFAKDSAKRKILVCNLKDNHRSIQINLDERYDLNSKKGLKAEFFLKGTSFGHCMLEISSSNETGTQQSEYNSIYFEKRNCQFISEKQSKDLELTSEGSIRYNIKINGLLDIFGEKSPLKCDFKKS